MKNKGFTLIELLGVIVILSILAIITTTSVTSIVKRSREELNETQIESIKLAAEVWGTDNLNLLPNEGECSYITLEFLKSNALLSDEIINASTNEEMDDLKIKITTTKNKVGTLNYTYEVNPENVDNCNLLTNNYVCKRATTLHEEICTQSNADYYCSGAGYKANSKITYGSLGTDEKLNVGDAFDCDVNGDGKYNSETERFYYVSGLNGDETSDIAVLIYYNNVLNGIPDNTTSSLISYYIEGVNNLGPITAITNLPTTSKWNNVSLSNTTRQITNESGKTTTNTAALTISKFSYKEKSARLLTYQEITSACGSESVSSTGKLDTCEFLLENTKYSSPDMGTYGYWLETPRSTNSSYSWYVYASYRNLSTYYSNDANYTGVRPVIEVPKLNILY